MRLYLAMGLWHCLSISYLVGKLFKIGIPKFRETCRLASTLHGSISQRKFGNGPCIYAGIELSISTSFCTYMFLYLVTERGIVK